MDVSAIRRVESSPPAKAEERKRVEPPEEREAPKAEAREAQETESPDRSLIAKA